MLLYSLGACLNVYRADVLVEQWSGVMFVSLLLCLFIQFYLNCFVENGDEEISSCEFFLFFKFKRREDNLSVLFKGIVVRFFLYSVKQRKSFQEKLPKSCFKIRSLYFLL